MAVTMPGRPQVWRSPPPADRGSGLKESCGFLTRPANQQASIQEAIEMLACRLWHQCAVVARRQIAGIRSLTAVLCSFHADRVGRTPNCLLQSARQDTLEATRLAHANQSAQGAIRVPRGRVDEETRHRGRAAGHV